MQGQHDADEEQRIDLQRLGQLRVAGPVAERRWRRDCGALGWMKGLPKKKARPVPSIIMAMPTAMSFTLGSLQM
jgi:hypothetical protein